MSGAEGPGASTAHAGHGGRVGMGETALGGSEQTLFQRTGRSLQERGPGPCGASRHHAALLMGQ